MSTDDEINRAVAEAPVYLAAKFGSYVFTGIQICDSTGNDLAGYLIAIGLVSALHFVYWIPCDYFLKTVAPK